ncbi:uncharacterized protein LOC131659676 [Vicia villosa]|uniref:uncharacterized protein LOC131659676 n=1 Tax=Vicia villosa TaxID=3911 RepID=UPI00273CAB6C|nr:uncharacterized protein LOC131659676 [Vicia villosa]
MEDAIAFSMWSNTEVGFSFSNSNGRSGGILTLWRKYRVKVLQSFKGEGFLGIKIIGGDFNAIKSSIESKGGSDREMVTGSDLFGRFIDDNGLVDVPCKGKKFTWYSGDGRSMGSGWSTSGGKRHFGPLPEWKEMEVEGRGDFVLKEKLSQIKERLKWWNKTVFGRIELEAEDIVRDLNYGDSRLEDSSEGMLGESLNSRNDSNKRFWLNFRIKENMLVQKSRLKWLNDGDSNSSIFHNVLKERRRHNHLGIISMQRGLVEKVEEVREEVRKHFSNKFLEEDSDRILLDGISFKSISFNDVALLERLFQMDEIKEAIDDCGSSKNPGPDGFSFLFIK